MYFQSQPKCDHLADNNHDDKFCPIQYIEAIIFASEMVHFDDNIREYKHGFLILNHWKVYSQYHLQCQHFADNEGDNRI